MADNYGGLEGHLRAQRAIPKSQKDEALRKIEEEIKNQRAKYNSSRELHVRQRAEGDLAGAMAMRAKINKWEVE